MDEPSQISAAPTDTVDEPVRRSVLEMSQSELEEAITAAGLPAFRARQLWRWVWRHGLTSFDEMSDLGKPVRAQFADMLSLGRPAVTQRLKSSDGTIK